MAAEREALVMDRAPALSEEEGAFARRSDEYLPRALGLAFYILGNTAEAEDATQEAMARAWKARRSLRRAESFEAWVDRIIVNTCREKLRRSRRVREVDLSSEAEREAPDRFGALLSRDSVGRALLDLSAEQRAVVVLRYWRDMSLEQISRQLDWPLGTVKSRLHHVLAALKERLEHDDSEVRR